MASPDRSHPPHPSRLVCAGCGWTPAAGEVFPFRCTNTGRGDVDHVLEKQLFWREAGSPGFWREVFRRDDPNPFVRYRELLHSYHDARHWGLADADWVEVVRELDAKVRGVDGRAFVATPFVEAKALGEALAVKGTGSIRVKDETGNVAGSHKSRHLMGVLLRLAAAQRAGVAPRDPLRLAIFSCGNAALAAATLARAAKLPLTVFVPTEADAGVLERLRALGAEVVKCERPPSVPGDPCRRRFHEAIASRGAIPFTVQGPENSLAVEGGETLAYEIVSTLLSEGESLDRLFVQVGGGALASACVQALIGAHELGLLARLPRIHAVQTSGGAPLARAWERFVDRFPHLPDRAARNDAVTWAAGHRSSFMWPWEEEPKSAASGILDDETYDWLAVVHGMAETGGSALVVSEGDVIEATQIARRSTGITVSPTGAAGLAGYLAARRFDVVSPTEKVAVLFTGAG
ncbi:MAG: pyridoxal-phosphate dependent enzyme [bacterium]